VAITNALQFDATPVLVRFNY